MDDPYGFVYVYGVLGLIVSMSVYLARGVADVNKRLEAQLLEVKELSGHLEHANKELEEYSHTLEQKVSERTQELGAKNVELEEALGELRDTQIQLVQSEKMASLGQLTAGIAHELKNPLNFVNNFAQINAELLDEIRQSPDSRIKDYLEAIEDARSNARQIAKHGKRADRIVQSMMQHASQSEGERYQVEVNPFVDEYVDVAYKEVRSRLPNLGVTIERKFDDLAV